MKKILIFLLCLASCSSPVPDRFQATVVNPITVIHLKGTMPGWNLTGKSGIDYVMDSGVNLTSPIYFGNTSNITFEGPGWMKYSGTGTMFNTNGGNNVNIRISNIDGGTASNIFDVSGNYITYTGTPQTCAYFNLSVDSFRLSPNTMLYSGTWEAPTTYHNVSIGIFFNHGVCLNNGTNSNVKIFGQSIYSLILQNTSITGGNTSNVHDEGIVFIQGNAKILNCYRNGGRLYVERIIQVEIGGDPFDQRSQIINTVDVNSTNYGTVDVRIDTSLLRSNAAIPLTAKLGFDFINNTSGNKKDLYGTYVTSAVVMGNMIDDLGKKDSVQIRKNLAYNANVTNGTNGSSLVKNNAQPGTYIMDSSNNIDILPGVACPVGWLDSNYYPIPGSAPYVLKIGAQYQIIIVPPVVVNPCPIVPPVYVHDTTIVKIHDTTVKQVHDTTIKQIHDTTKIPFAVHDTVAARVIRSVIYFENGTIQQQP
jgi:hypothetical protein